MTMIRTLGVTALLLGLAACADSGGQSSLRPVPGAVPASSAAPGVADLVGAQATAGGAAALVERGYVIARRQGTTTRFWWNRAARSCLSVVTINGRYRAIDPAAPADCGQ
ncbi:hypothetical protein [Plastoroseomonas hellenica]|uniref:hypothetical protein n=1 Tax=Plastoroseomonas hellenica TaxID=2687306 RepID=UPI001BA45A70|nr:hypothetical protein [Plastoroseomonas hellenica]MBR0647346.1 hypothetical protein [Plastoroseomonas hellenica]